MRFAKTIKRVSIGLLILIILLLVVAVLIGRALVLPDYSMIGNILDEARLAVDENGDPAPRLAPSFRAQGNKYSADDEYFVEMEKGLLKKDCSNLVGQSRKDCDEGEKIREGLAKALTTENFTVTSEDVRKAGIRGQNTWIVWTGGNDRFWDDLASKYSFGTFDLLKILSNYDSTPDDGKPPAYSRDNRWEYLGVVNEPCFNKATEPGKYGLWLDTRDPNCPGDPFADAEKYPGVRIGARGKNIPVGSFYGEPSGVVGLRLFPNPNFDEDAEEDWDSERYFNDLKYYYDKNLVRPYRVGMSCGFCHVGPNPVYPPDDPENPKWKNLASNPGAQYYWVNRIFFWNSEHRQEKGVPAKQEHNFVYQLFHTNPPGTLDTSLVSTDYLNNPRTMNAVYSVGARLDPTLRWGTEKLTGDELDNKQFNDYPRTKALGAYWNESKGEIKTARVLKDGADAVGILGALNRVYLNIGLFSEEWVEHFRPVIGGQKITPIRIADAQKNSSYWNATEDQTPDMAVFFLATATPDDLKDAPDGKDHLTNDRTVLSRGKTVFAENCAVCHSSKIPQPPPESGVDTGDCANGGNGPNYRVCWDRYWAWSQTDDFKTKMVELASKRDPKCPDAEDPLLCNNFLSTERRVPVDQSGTNACSPIATNALDGDIWDNFSSTTYKQLPPVGELTVHHPVSGGASPLTPLGNGRGYTRPASLISLWSTAPFLLNNSVGHLEYYTNDYGGDYAKGNATSIYGDSESYSSGTYSKPSYGSSNYDSEYAAKYYDYGDTYGGLYPYNPGVKNRMKVFTDSINKMLNPELRRKDTQTKSPVPGYIYRTTAASCLVAPYGFLPDYVQWFSGLLHWITPWAIDAGGNVRIGPFPQGMPVNLLTNTKLIPDHDEPMGFFHLWKLLKLGLEFRDVYSGLYDELTGDLGAYEANAGQNLVGGICDPEFLRTNQVRTKAKDAFYNSNLVDELLNNSKCPDFVVNRGHYYGSDLSQSDKAVLIEYLKTF